ncbi:MAG: hypothetical protein Q4G37_06360, partial [Bifidobacterium sp.]|nr:hypothetical protein [Bifidobacterium sp.]
FIAVVVWQGCGICLWCDCLVARWVNIGARRLPGGSIRMRCALPVAWRRGIGMIGVVGGWYLSVV